MDALLDVLHLILSLFGLAVVLVVLYANKKK